MFLLVFSLILSSLGRREEFLILAGVYLLLFFLWGSLKKSERAGKGGICDRGMARQDSVSGDWLVGGGRLGDVWMEFQLWRMEYLEQTTGGDEWYFHFNEGTVI